MTKSRTFRWILLIAVVGLLGYFGWQRFGAQQPAATASNAQKAAPPAVRVTIAPVEKAETQQVRPQKSPAAVQYRGEKRCALTSCQLHLGRGGRVRIHLGYHLLEIDDRLMHERCAQTGDTTVHDQTLMRVVVAEAS